MDWTKDKPTKEGRYNARWLRRSVEECTVAIDEHGQVIVSFDDGCCGPVEHFDCEWQGPITPE